MNIKRIIFWIIFLLVLAAIIWGLSVAMNKQPSGPTLGTPAAVTVADHVRGPENAPVTVIEYSDFQCPACAAYFPLVEKLVDESTSTVRFVYRHFPLYPLPHKNSYLASQASEAAALQGKFWEMHRLLFTNQTTWENPDAAAGIYETYAERIGLNMETYKKDFNSSEVKARIQRDREEGDRLGVNATPTFFVNGKAIVNPQGYDAFKALIQSAALGGTN